jgi:hypothetical protein
MGAPEVDPQAASRTRVEEHVADPFSEAADGETTARMRELLGVARETARGMFEAEEALRLVRERFEHEQDAAPRGELAAQALVQVERQLDLARARRQQLDSIEGRLWTRRNRLERFLIHTRGRAWWHARRKSRASAGQSQGV